jgi:hypothetical protein
VMIAPAVSVALRARIARVDLYPPNPSKSPVGVSPYHPSYVSFPLFVAN